VLFTPGNFYLETALRELPGTLVDVRTEADESAMRAAMRGYDIAVFDRITPPALKTGNFLLVDVAPADTEFHVPQRLSATTVTGTGDSALVRGLDLSKVRVGAPRNMQLRTSPSVQRLFWSADADLGVSTLHPGRRAVYLSFDLLDSNFPRQTAFPLFIRRAVQWLAASSIATYSQAGQTALVRDSRERRRQVPVGESFTLELAPGTEEISIATPDGSAEVVALTSPRYTFTETAKAGLYRYTAAGVTHYIAANLTDENESDINRRAPDQPTVAASQRVTQKGIVKFALWPYFAWTALILLMAEWWVWSMRREHA
nr:hypothetical protein [Gammaproteobacteria bacterium]